MAKKPSSSKESALLRMISQKTKPPSPTSGDRPPQRRKTEREPSTPPSIPLSGMPGKTPKFSSIYLNTQDQGILGELRLWFTEQGVKINDTLMIRAALRYANDRKGRELLVACDTAAAADRRKKPRD